MKENDTEQKIVKELMEDFKNRQQERKSYETQWLMNMNFYMGNQFCDIGYGGEIEDLEKQYFWQEREIFNHIAPILDTRIAKLTRIKPKATVLPASKEDKDVMAAKVSKQVLSSATAKLDLESKITEAMCWSELCGTSFYKITWNSAGGEVIGLDENGQIKSGEVDVTVCSPFEIYPDSNTCENVDSCQSIIHARAMDVEKIKSVYGIDVKGEDISVFSLDSTSVGFGGLGYSSAAPKVCHGVKKSSALVIEKYVKSSPAYPKGRLTIVVGNKLFYDGDNPFAVGKDGVRDFPFVRQVCLSQVASFWGISVIDRLIPVQRSYNAVKNRKHEFMNRLTMGVLKVEDGSVDIDNLEEDGLCPGKILVYRQGANAPEFLSGENFSTSFEKEEEKLIEEFNIISGVNALSETGESYRNMSGVAIELMIEQGELRLNASAEIIKQCVKKVSQMILRLYKQYARVPRLAKIVGENGDIDLIYFNSSDISSDDIQLETENDITESMAQRRQVVFELIGAGLLNDQPNGMSNQMKIKALQLMGYGILEDGTQTSELHVKKAEKENLQMANGNDASILEIDDHQLHLDRHIAFMLKSDYEQKFKQDPSIEKRFLSHIRAHKAALKQMQ